MGVKLDKIGADLAKARKKRDEWDKKVKELERRYREEENTEIHDMVHAHSCPACRTASHGRRYCAEA